MSQRAICQITTTSSMYIYCHQQINTGCHRWVNVGPTKMPTVVHQRLPQVQLVGHWWPTRGVPSGVLGIPWGQFFQPANWEYQGHILYNRKAISKHCITNSRLPCLHSITFCREGLLGSGQQGNSRAGLSSPVSLTFRLLQEVAHYQTVSQRFNEN